MDKLRGILLVVLGGMIGSFTYAEPMEIFCSIRGSGALNCQHLVGRERKVMNADDVTNFIDSGKVLAYITLKSHKGTERTFMVDPKAPQYKRLEDIERNQSMSNVAKAKTDLFEEIERKVIKISDELDGLAGAAELVLYDPGITFDKMTRERRNLQTEVENYRNNKDKVCTSTPAFEQASRANGRLQQTLSNILLAFQTPDSCMSGFKVAKDREGAVDLRQLDTVGDYFKKQCAKK